MDSLLITQVRLVEPGREIQPGALLIRDGQIAAFGPRVEAPAGTAQIDGGGRLLTPGLIDIHTHGVGHNLYERSPEEIISAGTLLPQYGTTTVLPTLYRVMNRASLNHLAALAETLPRMKGASAPAFHLEGPFLALPGAGAETIPGDLGLLDELLAVCGGRVAAMSISPDSVNILPIIERLCERGIVPFITHTRANVDQTQTALAAGARHATHFYNVFLPPESEAGVRPVGAVETILADPRATVDFICDGTHVHPMAIRAAVAAKGWGGVILITDSNIGAGLPYGEYPTPWGFPVSISARGGARIADPKNPHCGLLAGSALTMNVGMKNLLGWLDYLPPAQVWAMGTLNVARLLGWKNKGRIEVGADADLVLWNDDLTPRQTWCGGESVYEKI